MTKEVEKMISEVAKSKLSQIINSYTPSQYSSELLKDIKQDLYLAYYKIRKEFPNIPDGMVMAKLQESDVTMPDERLVYVGENIENY